MQIDEAIFKVQRNPAQKVWGYVRVSSAKQLRDGEGIETQKAAITKYCLDNGLSEPLFVEEVASATTPMFEVNLKGRTTEEEEQRTSPRPIFLILLGHLLDLEGGHLVVWDLDRLARNTMDQEMFLRMLWDGKVDVHSTNMSQRSVLDGGSKDPQRVLFRTILGAFKQYEASVIEARLNSGLIRKAATGGYTGGQPPFGYRSSGKELKIDDYESKMVRFIFYLRKIQGLSYKAIQNHILATKSELDLRNYNLMLLSRIIKREKLYKGIYTDRYGNDHNREDLRIIPDDINHLEEEIRKDTDADEGRRGTLPEPGADTQWDVHHRGERDEPRPSTEDTGAQEQLEVACPEKVPGREPGANGSVCSNPGAYLSGDPGTDDPATARPSYGS